MMMMMMFFFFSKLLLYIPRHPLKEEPRLLHNPDLRPQRAGRGPVVGQLLADCGRRPGPHLSGSPHRPHDHHPEHLLLLQPTEGLLRQSPGRLAGGVHAFCFCSVAGVCLRECDVSCD